MSEDMYSAEQMAALRELIPLIAPTPSNAERSLQQLDEMSAEELQEIYEGYEVLWLLQEIDLDDFTFTVDWKDTETFVAYLQELADDWGASVHFGVTDPMQDAFLETHSVPDLMKQAHASLLPQGLTLWNWDTQHDCYSVWISRTANDAAVQRLSAPLETRIRPGDQPF